MAMALNILPVSLCIISSLLLTGCINGTRIQQDYIEVRDKCRDVAEENYDLRSPMGRANTPLAVKNQNAVLAQIFSDCMRLNGWTVASPRPASSGGRPSPSPGMPTPSANPPAPPRYIDATPPRPANRQPINPQYQ